MYNLAETVRISLQKTTLLFFLLIINLALQSEQTFAQSLFSSTASYSVGNLPSIVAVSDFNNDGIPDFATPNYEANTVSIVLGNGGGIFNAPISIPTSSNPFWLAVGDLNNDHNSDLVIANYANKTISTRLGNGNGTFQNATNYTTPGNVRYVELADFNRDGLLDVAVANYTTSNISIRLGNGDGTLQTARTYAVGESPGSMAAGDYNSDGILDLAVANYLTKSVGILNGNGDGTFQAMKSITSTSGPYGIKTADVNKDGILDLVSVNFANANLGIRLGNGDGTFLSPLNYLTGASAYSLRLADINGDGNIDILVPNSADDNISVLLGKGNGTFQNQVKYTAGNSPRVIDVADFNGDGRPDLAVANAISDTVSLFFGQVGTNTSTTTTTTTTSTTSSTTTTVPQTSVAAPRINSPVSGTTSSPSGLTFSGTGPADTYITIYDGKDFVDFTYVEADLTWSLTLSEDLDPGIHTFTATASNEDGTESNPSNSIVITISTQTTTTSTTTTVKASTSTTTSTTVRATTSTTTTTRPTTSTTSSTTTTIFNKPPAPVILSPNNGSSAGPSELSFSGTGSADTIINLYDNGDYLDSVFTESDGTWSLTLFEDLSTGTHTFTATTTNDEGIESDESNSITVTILVSPTTTTSTTSTTIRTTTSTTTTKTSTSSTTTLKPTTSTTSSTTSTTLGISKPPAPTILSPQNGSSAGTSELVLSGIGQAELGITIYDNGEYLDSTYVEYDNSWSVTLSENLAPGIHNFTATAVNEQGEESEVSNQITITILETTTTTTTSTSTTLIHDNDPQPPQLYFTLRGVIHFNGLGLANVNVNAGNLGSTITERDGVFSFEDLEKGSSYTITPTKEGYNFSPPSISGIVGSDVSFNFTASAIDSDIDGVYDIQEELDGSDPKDRGSALTVLKKTICSEWNGFLNMWNIMENINLSSAPISVLTSLYSIDGTLQSNFPFVTGVNQQFDLLVHDLNGFKNDTYGKICATITEGSAGDLDGRMVYYRRKPGGGANSFQFAFATPLQNPIKGSQHVFFNANQPSSNLEEQANPVANWIQLTNNESQPQSGTLIFYNQSGRILRSQRVNLNAEARNDFAAHEFIDKTGTVGWYPDSSDAGFTLRNVRYLYDNPYFQDSFTTAFQTEGVVGSGKLLVAPVDTTAGTSVLEIANVTNEYNKIVFNAYDIDGYSLQEATINLAPHQSFHIILNSYFEEAQGMVSIQGNNREGTIATVMQYGYQETGNIRFVYGLQAKESLGVMLRGSYNTFLAQQCDLLLVNSSASNQYVTISMVRYDQTRLLNNFSIFLPPNGSATYNLCQHDRTEAYGIVSVQPNLPNTIVAHVIRKGFNDQYRFPTSVRQ